MRPARRSSLMGAFASGLKPCHCILCETATGRLVRNSETQSHVEIYDMTLDLSMGSYMYSGHEAAAMAFFNDLVRVIAEVEGMDPMTVRGIGLSVREGGHISKGGRGLSAAKMTVRDSANMLIGVNGCT